MFRSHKEWVSVSGRVVEMQLLPGKTAPHPKLFIVELHPQDSAPVQAEIRVRSSDSDYAEIYFSTDAEVGFLFNPATQEARFDRTDPRNSMSARVAAGAAWADADFSEPKSADSGPPWLVLPACPSCRKQVDQGRAAMENQPHCPSCLHPLPAYPLVTSEHKHKH